MSVQTVGKSLVEHCNKAAFLDAINKHYADGVVSVEAAEVEGMPRTMEGIEAIRGKTQWFVDNHEIHSTDCKGPFPHGEDRFAVVFDMEVTPKGGERRRMTEVGLYTVEGDKIVKEEFFYAMPG